MSAVRSLVARELRRRGRGLVAIGLLAGLVGLAVVAALAGLRRTTTAYDRLLVATNYPEAFVEPAGAAPDDLAEVVAGDPAVEAAWLTVRPIGRTEVTKDWYYPFSGPERPAGHYTPVVDSGRLPADSATDEIVLSVKTARQIGLRIGDSVVYSPYTSEQLRTIDENNEEPPAGPRITLRVVGLIRDPMDAAMSASQRYMLGGPAFYRAYGEVEFGRAVAVWFRHGATDIDGLRERLGARLGPVIVGGGEDERAQSSHANQVLRVGLGLFAAATAVAGAYVVGQAARRHFASQLAERETLTALGMTRRAVAATVVLPGVVSASVAGLVTLAGALAVSPAFPVGNARLLEPHPGVAANWAILLPGAALVAIVVVLVVSVVAVAELRRAHGADATVRPSPLARAARDALPSPAVTTGIGFALEPGGRRSAVPVRSTIGGAVLGVAGVIGAIGFVASADRVVSSTDRFGIDYDLSIETNSTTGVPGRLSELVADKDLEAVSEERCVSSVLVADTDVEACALVPHKGDIRLGLRSGRAPVTPDEAALGPRLARDLGVGLGDTFTAESETGPHTLVVVGTTLSPSTTSSGGFDRAMVLDADGVQRLGRPFTTLLTRYGPGVDDAAKTRELDQRYPYGVMDESTPELPSGLSNLGDVRVVPRLLAGFFAMLAAAALAHGLLVTAGRRQRDLAVLRGLGFTAGDARAAVGSMAATTALVTLFIGVPVGLLLAALTWRFVADGYSVAADLLLPVAALGALALGVVATAAAVAVAPARQVARIRPAEVLRALEVVTGLSRRPTPVRSRAW